MPSNRRHATHITGGMMKMSVGMSCRGAKKKGRRAPLHKRARKGEEVEGGDRRLLIYRKNNHLDGLPQRTNGRCNGRVIRVRAAHIDRRASSCTQYKEGTGTKHQHVLHYSASIEVF